MQDAKGGVQLCFELHLQSVDHKNEYVVPKQLFLIDFKMHYVDDR